MRNRPTQNRSCWWTASLFRLGALLLPRYDKYSIFLSLICANLSFVRKLCVAEGRQHVRKIAKSIESPNSTYNRSRTQKQASAISILCYTALRVLFWRLWQLRYFENHISSRMAFPMFLTSRDTRRVSPVVTRLTVYRRLQVRRHCVARFRQLGNGHICGIDPQQSIVLINRKFIPPGCNTPPSVS